MHPHPGLITGNKDKWRRPAERRGPDEHSGGGGGSAGWQFAVEWLIK